MFECVAIDAFINQFGQCPPAVSQYWSAGGHAFEQRTAKGFLAVRQVEHNVSLRNGSLRAGCVRQQAEVGRQLAARFQCSQGGNTWRIWPYQQQLKVRRVSCGVAGQLQQVLDTFFRQIAADQRGRDTLVVNDIG
ncbi:hypothetical protein D3C80_1304870 [compost metagenome]